MTDNPNTTDDAEIPTPEAETPTLETETEPASTTEAPAETKLEDQFPRADEMHVLDPAAFEFRRQDFQLQMREKETEEWRNVTLSRLFPLSKPEQWISVLGKEDKEIGIFLTLDGLDDPSSEALRDELRGRYLVPCILRIISCKDKFDLVEWTVETDRGTRVFLARLPHEDAQQPVPGRYMLNDLEGNRYDIPDINKMDEDSRKIFQSRI